MVWDFLVFSLLYPSSSPAVVLAGFECIERVESDSFNGYRKTCLNYD